MLVAAQHADARILHSPSSPISSRDTPANVHANRCTTGTGALGVQYPSEWLTLLLLRQSPPLPPQPYPPTFGTCCTGTTTTISASWVNGPRRIYIEHIYMATRGSKLGLCLNERHPIKACLSSVASHAADRAGEKSAYFFPWSSTPSRAGAASWSLHSHRGGRSNCRKTRRVLLGPTDRGVEECIY